MFPPCRALEVWGISYNWSERQQAPCYHPVSGSLSRAFLQMINPPDGAKQWEEGGGWSRYWPNHFGGAVLPTGEPRLLGYNTASKSLWCVGHWLGGGVRVHWPLLGVGLHGSVEALCQGACQRLPWTAPFQGHCSLTVHASSLMNSLIDLLPWPLHMQFLQESL